MVDHLTKAKRSWNMSRIRSGNTEPEKTVRSHLHRMGYRFSLQRKDLPGKPDIVLPKYKTVIFVHGCFWHQHKKCKDSGIPKSNVAFWKAKLEANVRRDRKNKKRITMLGWKVIIVWECELKKPKVLKNRLQKKLVL